MKPVIIIAGYAASGKTTLARQLAVNLGFSFIDLGSVIRQTTIDFLEETDCANEAHQALGNREVINTYMRRLMLAPTVNGNNLLDVRINGKILDANNPRLRESFLDDRTLLLARLIRPKLIPLQREAAGLRPVVFSARNALAFTENESIRIFIEPGMTTRVRRRARYEGTEYGNLLRPERRDLINRVVCKEGESIKLEVALSSKSIAQEGFAVFTNPGSVEQSLLELTELTANLMTEKGWEYRLGKERFLSPAIGLERRGTY